MIVWNQKEAGIKPAEKRKWYTLKYRKPSGRMAIADGTPL